MAQTPVMEGGEERNFAARLRQLPETAAFVEAFCQRHGVGQSDALRITLLVEELFTNTVVHGYHGDSDALIRLVLAVDADAVAVLYEDCAPPHDPLSRLPAAMTDPDATLGSRPIGGLGLLLVSQLASSVRYAREDGCNRLWLRIQCSS
jgi:serine/threonine-protein kinase RsbW